MDRRQQRAPQRASAPPPGHRRTSDGERRGGKSRRGYFDPHGEGVRRIPYECICDHHGTERTQTRRIRNGGSTDFTLLEDLNALSRRCCRQPLPIEDLKEQLDAIRSEPHSDFLYYAGNVVGVGSFTAFFAGTTSDVIAASILGLIVSAMRKRLGKITPTPVIDNFVGSFLTGCLLGGTVRALPFLHMDAIMIGEVMLFVPGIAMTNAVRDVLSGDTMAGMMRLLESLLWTVALACGFMASLALINMLS